VLRGEGLHETNRVVSRPAPSLLMSDSSEMQVLHHHTLYTIVTPARCRYYRLHTAHHTLYTYITHRCRWCALCSLYTCTVLTIHMHYAHYTHALCSLYTCIVLTIHMHCAHYTHALCSLYACLTMCRASPSVVMRGCCQWRGAAA
jgi:hypothetical protein